MIDAPDNVFFLEGATLFGFDKDLTQKFSIDAGAMAAKAKMKVVVAPEEGPALIYVDRHLLYEVTSPQAFEGLRVSGRNLWRPTASL